MNDLTRPFSLDTYLADLAPLINLDCGTRTPAGVARVADIMTEKYEAIGWQVTRHQFAAECGPCLEATNAPGADHYDVMLVGHMDTVFPEGTAAKRPLKIEGNQAFGPGVSDMKSGLLSTWYALKELDPAVLARLKVLVCCNCDEEIGSPWSKEWLVKKAKQSGCVLVAEAARPSGDLISARKGNAKYRITFHGKASHAGSALTEGVSAITELAHWVLAINEQVNMTTGTTMNVGVVQGGTGVNVVPDFAEAIVDLRFWSNEEAAAVHDRLTFMANNPFLAGCRVEVDRQTFKPAMRNGLDGVQVALRAFRRDDVEWHDGLPVTSEYDDDVDLFEDLLGDLSKHLGTLARKSEVAERRHVDAAKGRERLELARATAATNR